MWRRVRFVCPAKGLGPLPNLSRQLCNLQEDLLDTLTVHPVTRFLSYTRSQYHAPLSPLDSPRDALCHSTRRRGRSPRPLGGAGSVRRRRTDCSWSGRGLPGAFHSACTRVGGGGPCHPLKKRTRLADALQSLILYALMCRSTMSLSDCSRLTVSAPPPPTHLLPCLDIELASGNSVLAMIPVPLSRSDKNATSSGTSTRPEPGLRSRSSS